MKKFLSIIGVLSLSLTPTITVIACGETQEQQPSPTPEVDKEFSTLVHQRAQGLIIGDQFNLSQKAVYQAMNNNQNRYHELFDETSIKTLNLNNSGIGLDGGILHQFLDPDLNLANILDGQITDIFKTIIESSSDINTDGFDQLSAAEQIGQVINALFLEQGNIDIALSFLDNLSSFLGLLMGILDMGLGSIDTSQIAPIISSIGVMVNGFIQTNLSEATIQPVFDALKTGTDLSRFGEANLTQLANGVILSFYNAIEFGMNPNFQGINLETTLVNNSLITSSLEQAAKDLYALMINGDFSQFNLMNNPLKIVENFMGGISILNLILSVYRTPELDLSEPVFIDDGTGNLVEADRSLYLFSNTVNNDSYVADKTKMLVKDLTMTTVDGEVPLNLKVFNYGELLANIQYYFNKGEHELQKLTYILLYNGTETNYSALVNFLVLLGGQFNSQIPLLKSFLPSLLIEPLVNNQEFKLGNFVKGDLWRWIRGAINSIQPGLTEKIEVLFPKIDQLFGEHIFTTLYRKDLRPLLRELKEILGDDLYAQIINGVDDLLGVEQLNIQNLLTLIPLKKYLSLGNSNYKNHNLPNYGSYYTKKTFKELLDELQFVLPVPENATTEQLVGYQVDFNHLESLVKSFLYDSETTRSFLNQIFDLFADPTVTNLAKSLFELLGFIDGDLEQGLIKIESFLGQLILFLAPAVATHELIISDNDESDLDSTIEVIYKDDLAQTHDLLTWTLQGVIKTLPHLISTDKVDEFVNSILASQDALLKVQSDDELSQATWFENSNDLKSYTFDLIFDPNKVSFTDQTKLTGSIIKYHFIVERNSVEDKFSFTQVEKTTIN